eukprot:g5713.t1
MLFPKKCCFCCCFHLGSNNRKLGCLGAWGGGCFAFWMIAVAGLAAFAAGQFFFDELAPADPCPHSVYNDPSEWKAFYSGCLRQVIKDKEGDQRGKCEKALNIKGTTKLVDDNSPPGFTVNQSDWEKVNFTARDGVLLQGYLFPAKQKCAPAITLLHGRGVCKENYDVLMPAAMLWRHGFTVLAFDTRNHGASSKFIQPGMDKQMNTWGATEYNDVLGAWDYVQKKMGINSTKVGIYGQSMGGSSSLIALGEEPNIRAAWVDSAVCSARDVLANALATQFGGILVGLAGHAADWGYGMGASQIKSVDPNTKQGYLAVKKLKSHQHLHFTRTTGDIEVPEWSTRRCTEGAKGSAAGANVIEWVADDRADFGTADPKPCEDKTKPCQSKNTHSEAMLYYTEQYEKRIVDFFKKALGSDCGVH